jgi:Xaa-Pro dipeptidase
MDDVLNITERDRRWSKIRAVMQKRLLDCLIIWGSHGLYRNYSGNLRYLSNSGAEGYMLFPLQDEPTLFGFTIARTPWVADFRGGHPVYSKAISERIRELRLEKARIGLLDLSGYCGEASFPHATYVALSNRFPDAQFEDATDILVEARMVKSPAEISCIEYACEIAEKAIKTILDTAKPGVKDLEVKAKMMDTLFREGSEPGTMILYHSGKQFSHGGEAGAWTPANPRVLELGDIIHTEFDASYCGYKAQFNQPFSLGKPNDNWQRIFDVALESINSGLSVLRPGLSVGDWIAAFVYPIVKAGFVRRTPNFHGLGLSIEEPFGDFPAQPNYYTNTTRILEPGMVFEIEPPVISPNQRIGTTIGCPILITNNGYRFLSKNWKPEVKIIG